MVDIFQKYESQTSLYDDFPFYDQKQLVTEKENNQ